MTNRVLHLNYFNTLIARCSKTREIDVVFYIPALDSHCVKLGHEIKPGIALSFWLLDL